MSVDKSFLILNPAAGAGRAKQLTPGVLEEFKAQGLECTVLETRYHGHAQALVADAIKAGGRRFIAAGGDGTTYEVLNGLFQSTENDETLRNECSLGLLPLGTGNSFLRDFGIDTRHAAVEAITRGQTQQVDVIEADHREGRFYYINLLSLGFPADVGHVTNTRFKGLGTAGYALATVVCLSRLAPRELPARLDDRDWDRRPSTFLTFSNSRFTGGTMMMAPKADVRDGWLDVIRLHPMGRLKLLRSFPKIFKGTHTETQDVESARAKTVAFDIPKQDVMVDGEILSVQLEQLEVLPGALKLIV